MFDSVRVFGLLWDVTRPTVKRGHRVRIGFSVNPWSEEISADGLGKIGRAPSDGARAPAGEDSLVAPAAGGRPLSPWFVRGRKDRVPPHVPTRVGILVWIHGMDPIWILDPPPGTKISPERVYFSSLLKSGHLVASVLQRTGVRCYSVGPDKRKGGQGEEGQRQTR